MSVIQLQINDIYESTTGKTVARDTTTSTMNFSGAATLSIVGSSTPSLNMSAAFGSVVSSSVSIVCMSSNDSQFTTVTIDPSLNSNSVKSWSKLERFFIGSQDDRLPSPIQLTKSLATEIDRLVQEEKIERQALEILVSEPRLLYYMGDLYDALSREMANLTGNCTLQAFSDPESTRAPMLVLECKVNNMTNSELIHFWKGLSLRLFQHTPKDIRKRIALTMSPI